MGRSVKKYDVLIIGGGAAGMMAAITAARRNKRVVILEHKDKLGKKIMATGNGKCNFTNSYMEKECFNGDDSLIKHIFSDFTMDDTLKFFKELGVLPKARNGYYYPNSETAITIVKALEFAIEQLGVQVICDCNIEGIFPDCYGYIVDSSKGSFMGDKLVIATGLLANPKLGSDGSLMDEIKSLGHSFIRILPSLCGFKCSGMNFKAVSGVRVEATVVLLVDGCEVRRDRGEVQLADYGISGIPVFQISSAGARAISEKKTTECVIDFLPGYSEEELLKLFKDFVDSFDSKRSFIDIFNGVINHKLISELIRLSGISANKKISETTIDDIHKIVGVIKQTKVIMKESRGFEFAQVCSGGIKTEDIDTDTLESKLNKGLYFAGEILNVDGICGGYNLQWAWTSGYIVGCNV